MNKRIRFGLSLVFASLLLAPLALQAQDDDDDNTGFISVHIINNRDIELTVFIDGKKFCEVDANSDCEDMVTGDSDQQHAMHATAGTDTYDHSFSIDDCAPDTDLYYTFNADGVQFQCGRDRN